MQEVNTDDSAVATARKFRIPIFKRTILMNYFAVKLDITDLSNSQLVLVIALDRFDRVNIITNNIRDSKSFKEVLDN